MNMKVKVEKIAKNKRGFVCDGTWYNFFRDVDPANLPKNIVEGCTIEITDSEENDRGNFDFWAYEVVSKAPAKSGGNYGKSGGIEDPRKQELIVRQNALTNACALMAVVGGTPQEAIDVMELFAAAVLGTSAKPAAKSSRSTRGSRASSTSSKRRQVQQELDEEPPFDLDDED